MHDILAIAIFGPSSFLFLKVCLAPSIGLVVTEKGVLNRAAFGKKFIKWQEVKDIKKYYFRSMLFIDLEVESSPHSGRYKKYRIATWLLKIEPDELFRIVEEYYKRYGECSKEVAEL